MIASILYKVSTVTALIVLVSFTLFAVDQAGAGSDAQLNKIRDANNEPAPSGSQENRREADHTKPRELVDDANDFLVKPFVGIADPGDDVWLQRGITSLLALLAYGLLLRLLAGYAQRLP